MRKIILASATAGAANAAPKSDTSSTVAGLVEPSNAEQADWPDATRDYVHGLEALIRQQAAQIEVAREALEAIALGVTCEQLLSNPPQCKRAYDAREALAKLAATDARD